jgi:hypothetical protein
MAEVKKNGKVYELENLTNETLQKFLNGEIDGLYLRDDVPVIVAKTAKDYKNFSDRFFLEFSQDCIDAKNSIETNDDLENHFIDIFDAIAKARLDKVYFLLLNSTLLLPFYTQEVKDRYVAKLQAFLS